MTKNELSETAKKRMGAMVSTTDGFRLAELDMELRGPGEMDGTRQSGLPEFKVADLTTDQAILGMARESAIELIREDPELVTQRYSRLKEHLKKHGFLTHWGKVS
jgi:ATP-dependent DNA helicase RecG